MMHVARTTLGAELTCTATSVGSILWNITPVENPDPCGVQICPGRTAETILFRGVKGICPGKNFSLTPRLPFCPENSDLLQPVNQQNLSLALPAP